MHSLNLSRLLSLLLLLPLGLSAPIPSAAPICFPITIDNVPVNVQQDADSSWTSCGEGSQVIVTAPAAGQNLFNGPTCIPLTFQGEVVHIVAGANGAWSNCGVGSHLQVVAARQTPTALDAPLLPNY